MKIHDVIKFHSAYVITITEHATNYSVDNMKKVLNTVKRDLDPISLRDLKILKLVIL